MGRPKGSVKYQIQNGIVDEDKLFLFIKKETIPVSEQKRFIDLCDRFIQSLGADTLNDADIEEIALIYRDRIYMDLAYEIFAQAKAIDSTMVTQIEKINKSLEVRKMNLGSRFIDREKTRNKDTSNSFLDLFNYITENKEEEEGKATEVNKKIKENKKQFTDVHDYMKNKLSNKSPIEQDENK